MGRDRKQATSAGFRRVGTAGVVSQLTWAWVWTGEQAGFLGNWPGPFRCGLTSSSPSD